MMKHAASALVVVSAATLLAGCSSSDKKVNSSTSTVTSKTASAAGASSSAAANHSAVAVDPSAMVTGSTRAMPTVSTQDGAQAAVPSTVKFVIGPRPFGPASVTSAALDKSINASLPVTGVMAEVGSGATVKPAAATKPLGVVWMDASSVLKVDQVLPCSGTCAAVKAPSGTTRVMVIPQAQIAGIGPDASVSAG